jgi:DNA polymerase III epsilon subunit-like protein
MKQFYLNTETTGTNESRHGLVQIAGIYYDGGLEQEINLYIKPFPGDEIDPKAMEVHGLDPHAAVQPSGVEFLEPKEAYRQLVWFLGNRVNKYDKQDKMHIKGYNVAFDIRFLRRFFEKNDNSYFESYFYPSGLDIYALACYFLADKPLPNYKLTTVADHLGLNVDMNQAHGALYDIWITKAVETGILYYIGVDRGILLDL